MISNHFCEMYIVKKYSEEPHNSVFFVSKCILDLTMQEVCINGGINQQEVNMRSEKHPTEQAAAPTQSDAAGQLMKWGMAVCCSVMVLPVAAFLVGGDTIAGLWTNASVFAPVDLCVGAHVVMFKMMGKSCHSSKEEQDQESVADASFEDARASVPEVARQS